jgi:hypothetical protein
MTREELFSLTEIIFVPLIACGLEPVCRSLYEALLEVFSSDQQTAEFGLDTLYDTLVGQHRELDERSGISSKEWRERCEEFYHAARMYLDETWRPPAAAPN